MAPYLEPGDATLVSDVKDRVAACRKRLRVSRGMHKAKDFRNHPTEIFADIDTASAQTRPYTDEYEVVVCGAIIGDSEVGIT